MYNDMDNDQFNSRYTEAPIPSVPCLNSETNHLIVVIK